MGSCTTRLRGASVGEATGPAMRNSGAVRVPEWTEPK